MCNDYHTVSLVTYQGSNGFGVQTESNCANANHPLQQDLFWNPIAPVAQLSLIDSITTIRLDIEEAL